MPVADEPAVVVVAYRSDDLLAGCLAALAHPSAVTVVDNGTSVSTRSVVERAGARYVDPGGNLGFAAGVNRGLAAVGGGRDVLLLNPDAQAHWADVLRLQAFLREPSTRRAAVGPLLTGADGAPQRARWPMPSPGQVWTDALGLARLHRGPAFVTGAVLLLHADAIAELGGFDERYFLYAEEADWQRTALAAGWTVAVDDAVSVRHVGGATSSDPTVRERHAIRSGAAFARKWHGRAGAAVMWAGSVVAAARRAVLGPAVGRAAARRALRVLMGGGR